MCINVYLAQEKVAIRAIGRAGCRVQQKVNQTRQDKITSRYLIYTKGTIFTSLAFRNSSLSLCFNAIGIPTHYHYNQAIDVYKLIRGINSDVSNAESVLVLMH